jgi:hypothetical protein
MPRICVKPKGKTPLGRPTIIWKLTLKWELKMWDIRGNQYAEVRPLFRSKRRPHLKTRK